MRYYNSLLSLVLIPFFVNATVVNGSKSGDSVNAKPVVISSSSHSLMPFSDSQKITIDDKASEKNELLSWCKLRGVERTLVNDKYGIYGFVTQKGLLSDNIEALIASFYPKNQSFINKTQQHRIVSSTCLLYRSKKEVIQKIIEPYRFKKEQIIFGNFTNDVAALFYRDDSEMSKYLKVR